MPPNPTARRRRCHAAAVALLLCGLPAVAADAGSQRGDLWTARLQLETLYAKKLIELAEGFDQEGLGDRARTLRQWLPPRTTDRLVLFVIEDAAAETSADNRFAQLRRDQGRRLWDLARQAAAQGEWEWAMQWATDALREDPGHLRAREALGASSVRDDETADGGVEAPGNGSSRSKRSQWQIKTDHFLVTTYHSYDEGLRLGTRLEQLYQVWLQVFTRCGISADELAWRFRDDDPAARKRPQAGRRRHRIVQYGSRAAYIAALSGRQPRIDMTLGIYFDQSRCGYFFAGEGQSPETLFHEATHQLFQESRRVSKQLGRRNNFWIVEGVATYMESLTDRGSYWTLGDPETGRFPAARQRALRDGFFIPLAELVEMGLSDLQRHADLPALYSQMAGLTGFLMHFDQGRYRAALIDYLLDVYADRADAGSLAQRTGTACDELDRQYLAYQAAIDAALAAPPE